MWIVSADQFTSYSYVNVCLASGQQTWPAMKQRTEIIYYEFASNYYHLPHEMKLAGSRKFSIWLPE